MMVYFASVLTPNLFSVDSYTNDGLFNINSYTDDDLFINGSYIDDSWVNIDSYIDDSLVLASILTSMTIVTSRKIRPCKAHRTLADD